MRGKGAGSGRPPNYYEIICRGICQHECSLITFEYGPHFIYKDRYNSADGMADYKLYGMAGVGCLLALDTSVIIIESKAAISLPSSETPRGAGVHASGIIRNIAVEMGILKLDQPDEVNLSDIRVVTDPLAILRMDIGLAWEEWYIAKILPGEGVVKHPGEISLDGVHMNPDGESVSLRGKKQVLVIHEVKATYKSTNREIEKEWMWITQIKCYCKAAKTRYGKLHVLFLCGDYKFPIRPVLKCWEIEFSQKELDDNWSLMVDYRDQRS